MTPLTSVSLEERWWAEGVGRYGHSLRAAVGRGEGSLNSRGLLTPRCEKGTEATAQFTTRFEMTCPALLTRYSTFWPPSLTTYT
jgi:hypothetical protein